MKRTLVVTCAAVALIVPALAQQPTFRSSVDFVELDVFVTDGRGAFVKDLTAADFEILDDDQPQAVSTFSLVDLPLPEASEPTSSRTPRTLESDVTTNAGSENERLWVMLLDAPDIDKGATYTQRTQNVARGFVESIGPNDSMAIIHVQGSRRASMPLTTSRARLFESIQRFSQGVGSSSPPSSGPEMVTRIRTTFELIEDVAERLGAISGRRKALVWIGGQIRFDLANLSSQLPFAYRDMIRAAQRHHVAIYTVDPYALGGSSLNYQGAYRAMAEDTGGIAVTNTNDFTRGYRDIVRDNSTYYLIGYSPKPLHTDGEFHRITVRTKRPGLTVRARRGYLAPTATATAPAPLTPIDELTQALRNPIPRRDVSIDVVATPVGSVKTAGSVLLTASVRAEQVVAADASVDVAFRIIDAEGRTLAERATRYPLSAGRPDSAGPVAIRFTDRVDLPRGRQEIRLAINMPGGKTGSAVTYVDLPNFKDNDLSLSGLSVDDAADGAVPVFAGGGADPSDTAVSTERRFPSSATLRVRASVYGRLDRPDEVAVTAQLRNAAGAVVRENLAVSVDAAGRVPQERLASIQVPLSGLQPGVYTLVVNAGTTRIRRPAATRGMALWVEP